MEPSSHTLAASRTRRPQSAGGTRRPTWSRVEAERGSSEWGSTCVPGSSTEKPARVAPSASASLEATGAALQCSSRRWPKRCMPKRTQPLTTSSRSRQGRKSSRLLLHSASNSRCSSCTTGVIWATSCLSSLSLRKELCLGHLPTLSPSFGCGSRHRCGALGQAVAAAWPSAAPWRYSSKSTSSGCTSVGILALSAQAAKSPQASPALALRFCSGRGRFGRGSGTAAPEESTAAACR
mmetsp:Transcript_7244/g.20422  ORF Transcript_7244/g.20422 Transcript_7244/m.20422 type:complete len:237 (+) Transcript_7244:279-989(+)